MSSPVSQCVSGPVSQCVSGTVSQCVKWSSSVHGPIGEHGNCLLTHLSTYVQCCGDTTGNPHNQVCSQMCLFKLV